MSNIICIKFFDSSNLCFHSSKTYVNNSLDSWWNDFIVSMLNLKRVSFVRDKVGITLNVFIKHKKQLKSKGWVTGKFWIKLKIPLLNTQLYLKKVLRLISKVATTTLSVFVKMCGSCLKKEGYHFGHQAKNRDQFFTMKCLYVWKK